MKFQVGDEVRVIEEASGVLFSDTVGDVCKIKKVDNEDELTYELDNGFLYREDCLEPITDHDHLMDKILERNNKPIKEKTIGDLIFGDPIEPEHYNKGEIDLFESAYRTRPFSEFRAIMEFIAERYLKRDKDNRIQDLDKAIYTLERLKEYEKLEETE